MTLTTRISTSRIDSDERTPAGTPIPIRPRMRGEAQFHEERDEDDGDDRAEGLDHIILAIQRTRKNTVGCSYYVARTGTLFFLEELVDANDEVIDTLKQDIQPTTILVSPHNDGLLAQEFSRQRSIDLSGDDELPSPYKIELRPLADFGYEQAVHKLTTVPPLWTTTGVKFLIPGDGERATEELAPDEMDLTDERGKRLHISSSINLENKLSVGCAGAIVTYLQRKRSSEYLHRDVTADDAYAILRLEMFSLTNSMLVNSDTLSALQIFQPESHPNAAMQGPGSSGTKESLSLYGLFYRFATTPQGKRRLRTMFLRPSLDTGLIKERQNFVATFARPQNQMALTKMSTSLKKIKNMRRIMLTLHKGVEGGSIGAGGIKSGVWSSLLDFCFHVIELCESLSEVIGFDRLEIFHQVHNLFDRSELQRLGKTMFDVVDLDESQQQRRTVIKRGINNDLDRVKDAYDGMDETLQQAAIETVLELSLGPDSFVPALTVLYIPQLGFHVLMPIEDATSLATRGINAGWQRMFITESFAYFKTDKMRCMDEDLGDMWGIICDIEIEISYDLAQRVLEREEFLVKASDLCGELDTLLTLAHGAVEYKLTRPRFVEENIIEIRGGRHLVQELTVPSYVPNDTFLVGGNGQSPDDRSVDPSDHSHMLILTGPNYSGKSVYLKQVALIVYLAQLGSFVPADSARLGISDKIMTRITTRETVSRGQSSFMIDLQQMAWALKAFTPRSLLVIDEFGKGTDNCDGAALAAGVFSYLLFEGDRAPKVIASTHFHEIFEQGLMSENIPGLVFRQMEVQLKGKDNATDTNSDKPSEVVYLYNVRPGRSTLSYGAQCAAMNGVPESVIARACQLTDLAMTGEDLTLACSYIPDEELQQLQEAESVSRAFFELDLNALSDLEAADFHTLLSDLIDCHCSTDVSMGHETQLAMTSPSA